MFSGLVVVSPPYRLREEDWWTGVRQLRMSWALYVRRLDIVLLHSGIHELSWFSCRRMCRQCDWRDTGRWQSWRQTSMIVEIFNDWR